MYILAVDVSKDSLSYHSDFASGMVKNSPEGISQLYSLVKSIYEYMLVCESTGVYSQPLMYFFHSKHVPTYYIPNDVFSHMRKIMKFPKNDKLDAEIIFHAAEKFPDRLISFQTFGELASQLKDLTRYRFNLSHDIARLKVRLHSLVFKYFPGLKFDFKATYSYFLRNYSIEEIVQMDFNDMIEIISKISHQKLNANEFANKLKNASKNAMRLKSSPQNALKLTINLTLDNINSQLKLLSIIDKEIEKFMKKIPQTLTTLPGISTITAAGIISEIGNIQRFSSPAKLASYAGITWSSYQSGTYRSQETHMNKKGNKYLRYYIFKATQTVTRFEPTFKSYYQKKYNEVDRHANGRALALSARKLVNVIYFMMANEKRYDPRELK